MIVVKPGERPVCAAQSEVQTVTGYALSLRRSDADEPRHRTRSRRINLDRVR